MHVHTREKLTFFGKLAILTVALGGFLFGYHLGVISGALELIEKTFSLGPFKESIVVSILLLGACVGSIFGGALCDRFGRQRMIIVTALLFTVGALIAASAVDYGMILLGRVVIGVAVGLIFLVGPLYLAEIAPPHLRGGIVATYQFATVIGILTGYVVNYLFFDLGNWRAMFALGMIPSGILTLAIFFFPETPDWLMAHGKIEKAKQALQRLRQDRLWEHHLAEMKKCASGQDVSWKRLLQPSVKFALFIGIMINVFQQITGINAVIYYSPKIFAAAGFGTGSSALVGTLGIGAINVIATFLALKLLDRLGRRPLLLIGIAGMIVSLLVLSIALFLNSSASGIISVITLISYVGFFAIGLGPVTGLLVAEIYPLSVRGKAMSLATTANWLCNFLVAQTFLELILLLGTGGAFLLLAIISIFAFFIIKRYVPETKGKSLEEIELSMAKIRK
jgi:SP family galactose:H+ symporter-like MFS transporter